MTWSAPAPAEVPDRDGPGLRPGGRRAARRPGPGPARQPGIQEAPGGPARARAGGGAVPGHPRPGRLRPPGVGVWRGGASRTWRSASCRGRAPAALVRLLRARGWTSSTSACASFFGRQNSRASRACCCCANEVTVRRREIERAQLENLRARLAEQQFVQGMREALAAAIYQIQVPLNVIHAAGAMLRGGTCHPDSLAGMIGADHRHRRTGPGDPEGGPARGDPGARGGGQRQRPAAPGPGAVHRRACWRPGWWWTGARPRSCRRSMSTRPNCARSSSTCWTMPSRP